MDSSYNKNQNSIINSKYAQKIVKFYLDALYFRIYKKKNTLKRFIYFELF